MNAWALMPKSESVSHAGNRRAVSGSASQAGRRTLRINGPSIQSEHRWHGYPSRRPAPANPVQRRAVCRSPQRGAARCLGSFSSAPGTAHRHRRDDVNGGEGGIRTHGTVARTPHFECGAFDHSATSPRSVVRRPEGPAGRRKARLADRIGLAKPLRAGATRKSGMGSARGLFRLGSDLYCDHGIV